MGKKTKTLNIIQDYIFIVLGLSCYAFGFTAFILPEKIVIGGVAGLASLVYFKWGINVALTNYAINILLLLIAGRIVGWTFVKRTIFGTTVLSFMIALFSPYFSSPIVEQQPFMNLIIGALLCGFGIGLTFVHNGSSGGTDIIAAMVSKHSNVTIGRTILYIDFLIISSSYLIFQSLDKVVYGAQGLYVLLCVAAHSIGTFIWRHLREHALPIAERGLCYRQFLCNLLDGVVHLQVFIGVECHISHIFYRGSRPSAASGHIHRRPNP